MGKLTRNFNKFSLKLRAEVNAGIQDWIHRVEMRSQAYVPLDTGKLKDSFLAERLTSAFNKIEYRVSYGNGLRGDNGENYAAEVHDWPQDKNWTTPGTGPRYLERAKFDEQSKLLPIVKKFTNI